MTLEDVRKLRDWARSAVAGELFTTVAKRDQATIRKAARFLQEEAQQRLATLEEAYQFRRGIDATTATTELRDSASPATLTEREAYAVLYEVAHSQADRLGKSWPEHQLDELATVYANREGIDFPAAYAHVLTKTAAGRELYSAYNSGGIYSEEAFQKWRQDQQLDDPEA